MSKIPETVTAAVEACDPRDCDKFHEDASCYDCERWAKQEQAIWRVALAAAEACGCEWVHEYEDRPCLEATGIWKDNACSRCQLVRALRERAGEVKLDA